MAAHLGRQGSAVKLGLLIAGAAAAASCGQTGELRPPPGQPLPVKPLMARTIPSPDDLLTPPPFARPQRIDEIQSRSEPREPDRFDLPPPDGGAAPAPEADGQTEDELNDPGPATPQ